MAKLRLFGGTDPSDVASPDAVAVIGLGRFGAALAQELMADGTDVLGIDRQEDVVQSLNGSLTHVVAGDATKEEVLRQLSVDEFDHVVVAISSNLEASILVTSLVLRFGVREVWAKATSDAHRAILEQLGVKHIIFPEQDMGRRVAHMVRGNLQDYILIDEDYALAKTTPPKALLGRPLKELEIRRRHGVTVALVKHAGEPWAPAAADTVLQEGDLLLVSGAKKEAEGFRRLR
ncbi:TrkA family potassium uptake protein [Nesterenkonia sp. CL21]|uniref:potassium channel family protein n=1 Tax=Nesterenkonia sp. CL21 TaxID=3064894 RepID=UPI00287A4F30|nr:TrkA family potassium uptake protein [Nesterenkonia sp. CL21]MDS2172312.1 TrkA family potassium uptake protein [Nesterenkonia sp. CL21]